jgi:type IV pilus assembly protein PilC
MGSFDYLATDEQNRQVGGAIVAANLLEAKTKLRQQGLYIIWVRPQQKIGFSFSFGSISNQDLTIFSHQFAVMISSGIPLTRALKALAEETSSKKLRLIIEKVRFDVENGVSLSSAISKHPEAFSEFFVSLVRSGEMTGKLAPVLERLASYLENQEDLRRKVASSFAYPVVVGIVAILVVAFLLIFIVPVFRSVYKTMKISLPGPTLVLITLSNIVIKFWWLVLFLIGLSIYLLRIVKQNTLFSLALDRLKLKLPLFGELNRKVAISRFSRTLSTMVESGIPLNSSLTIIKEVVGNKVFGQGIESIQKEINQGRPISETLKSKEFFPPIVMQMIAVGEESGNLNAMLDKCADFMDKDIDALVKSLVVKLEPALTFFLAILVGFIALAIYLPMFDLIRQISE